MGGQIAEHPLALWMGEVQSHRLATSTFDGPVKRVRAVGPVDERS
ncbi:hypothetical protein MGWOODY_Clf885 [hydrothermal vent metagenome]|uniref:Uncharacterized protein n=1 Tax=hydrothermal vent metagenome TaxID=652676 RepID=A0A160V7C2_9ZZZZ